MTTARDPVCDSLLSECLSSTVQASMSSTAFAQHTGWKSASSSASVFFSPSESMSKVSMPSQPLKQISSSWPMELPKSSITPMAPAFLFGVGVCVAVWEGDSYSVVVVEEYADANDVADATVDTDDVYVALRLGVEVVDADSFPDSLIIAEDVADSIAVSNGVDTVDGVVVSVVDSHISRDGLPVGYSVSLVVAVSIADAEEVTDAVADIAADADGDSVGHGDGYGVGVLEML